MDKVNQYDKQSTEVVLAIKNDHWMSILEDLTMNAKNWVLLTPLLFTLSLSACGGGGGSGGVSDDEAPPVATNFMPADNAVEVATDVIVSATFDKAMFALTISSASFSLANSTEVLTETTVDYDVTTQTVSLNPTNDLSLLTQYNVNLKPAITDLDGTALADTQWKFTTRDGGWQGAQPIASNVGGSSRPAIDVNNTGHSVAVWRQDAPGPGGINLWSSRFTPGVGWSGAEQIENHPISSPASHQVAIDSIGNATAVWAQNEGTLYNIWSNRFTVDTGWGSAERIEIAAGIGSARNPKIATNDDGVMFATWYRSEGDYRVIWTNRFTPETGWGVAEQLSNDGIFPDIIMDNSGTAMISWVQFGESNQDDVFHYTKQYTPVNGWDSTATLISSGKGYLGIGLALDKEDGRVALMGSRSELWTQRYSVDNGWGIAAPIPVSDTATQVFSARLGIDSEDNMLAVWIQRSGSSQQDVWANHFTHGSGWGTAERIETNVGRAEAPQLVIDNNGNGIVLWEQSDGLRDNLWGNRFSKGAGWGTAKLIEIENGGNAERVQIDVDSSGRALAVWSQFNGAESNIKSNTFK